MKKDGSFVMTDREASAFLIVFNYCESELKKSWRNRLTKAMKTICF